MRTLQVTPSGRTAVPTTGEQFCQVGDISLCYEAIGDPDAQHTVVLIMGLGLQMIWWRDDFCTELVRRGMRVVRFDNRDVGRSTRVPGPGVSALGFLRRRATATYSLGEMADDTAGLIEQVAPDGAHVVGVSLGSLIAQEVAIRHPARTRSLVSIMGRPGDGRSGTVAKRMLVEFIRPPSTDPVEGLVAAFGRIGSIGRTEQDDDDVRVAVRRSMRRGAGDDSGRQLAAILNERDRRADLGRLRIPALVIHGDRDRIIQPSGGRATASAIPGAELLEIADMGHDLARWTWPTVIDGIARTTGRSSDDSAW
jgi:pimeloyl-ACP methyl ester carboxylesterase